MTPAACPPPESDPATLLEQEGRVVAVERGTAWIETARSGACGGCGQAAACAVPVFGRLAAAGAPARVQVSDHLGLTAGERVVLGLPGGDLVRAAALVYLLPPLLLVIAAVAARGLGAGEAGSAAAGIGALGLGLALIRVLSGGAKARRRWRHVLVGRAGADRA